MKLLALISASIAFAQTAPKPILEFTGKPLRIDSRCKPEEVRSLGLSCSLQEPCAVFIELSDVEAVGSKLFVSGNLHTSTQTLESILLASEDSGGTWTEPLDRIAGAGLDTIQFIDFETGWISGHILQALPRDPFLLITNDGGRTWRRRPIFGETRVSSISQFRFDSKTSGSMVIDKMQAGDNGMRHELYESLTGGDSWMLRQVDSRPLALKQPKNPAAADWRLQPEAATKAYAVQKRSGEKWHTVASFLVSATDCKPAEPPEPELQPPSEDPVPPVNLPRPPVKAPTLKRKNP
jgi:Uncharacterized protein related to plant photosystem II stability/assembly factor